MENEDIFMQISNLNMSATEDYQSHNPKANNDSDAAVITNVGLPSARTLRGGASIVAKGRHGSLADRSMTNGDNIPPQSALSNFSSYSTSSSRYSSGTLSPTPSRRSNTQGLTPGLIGENRKSKLSPRKVLPK